MASDVEAMKTRQVILGLESFVEDMILLRCQKILYHIFVFHYAMVFTILEDLKVLRPSPDLLNNVKIGQGQLQLIMEQILFYHIWALQTFWSSDLNNLMNNPSNSPVISEIQMFG